ncbi:hypothetical protein LTR08_000358 [Meristemomyces frigidus]|nr:hypothetical protein LTR08_000358 [Meristemomyces frigidus]
MDDRDYAVAGDSDDKVDLTDQFMYGDSHDEVDWTDQSIDGDLHNEVHPIFHRIRFPGADYDKLLPALKLSSLFIDTDCLLDFWFALLFGPTDRVYHGGGEEDWHWAYFRPNANGKLSARDIARTRGALRTLAHMVTFHRDRKMDSAGRSVACEGYFGGGTRSLFYTGDFNGPLSHIYYKEGRYMALCNLSLDDVEAQQREHFSFAVLLVHEVAHAAYSAASRNWNDTIPFEAGEVGETGFEWEAHVFGGVADGMLEAWPSASRMQSYKAKAWHMTTFRDAADFDIWWHIPLTYIERLYTAEFWESTVLWEGAAALKVPHVLGYRYQVDDKGYATLFRPAYYSDDAEVGMPEDCCTAEHGDSSIAPIAPGFEWDGFGRLLKIDYYELFPGVYKSRFWHNKDRWGWTTYSHWQVENQGW